MCRQTFFRLLDAECADGWQLVWKQLASARGIPARTQHTICHDPVSNCVVLFGGYASPQGHLNDLWVLDLRTGEAWQPRDHGSVPTPRRGHIAEAVGNAMWLVGGAGDSGTLSDVYKLDLSSWKWSEVSILAPVSAKRIPTGSGTAASTAILRLACGRDEMQGSSLSSQPSLRLCHHRQPCDCDPDGHGMCRCIAQACLQLHAVLRPAVSWMVAGS